VTYPPPADYSHPIQYIFDSIQVAFPFIHPSIGWVHGSFTSLGIVFQVGIINVAVGGFVDGGNLASTQGLDTWFTS
jgi:hypothetical protein